MASGRYHVNPKTGRPNLCNATKKCPFGSVDEHYATKEEARRASVQGLPTLPPAKGKYSRGTKLLLEVEAAAVKVQPAFLALEQKRTPETQKAFLEAADARDALIKQLYDLPWDDSDGGAYDPDEKLSLPLLGVFTKGKVRQGYEKSIGKPEKARDELLALMDEASHVWLRRLSTAEVRAVVAYNSSPDDYAQLKAGVWAPTEEDKKFLKYFESAVAKAPKLEEHFVSYAGISEKRTRSMKRMGRDGTITLNRVQSATLNPAQVNAFMHYNDAEAVVVEFKQDRVASLTAFNIVRSEMEVLIPRGKYKVVHEEEHVEYKWSEKSSRTASVVFQVEAVAQDPEGK